MDGLWDTSRLNLPHSSMALTAFRNLLVFKIHIGEIFRYKDNLPVVPPFADGLRRVIRRCRLQLRLMDGDRPLQRLCDGHAEFPAGGLCLRPVFHVLVFLIFVFHGLYLLLLPPKGRPCRPEGFRFPVLGGAAIWLRAAMRGCLPCWRGSNPL